MSAQGKSEFRAGFPWGVLLISDARSREEIPRWTNADDQVAAATTALVVRVMHEDNGEVAVRVFDDPDHADGDLVFSGPLLVPSGTLRISDALSSSAVDVDPPATSLQVSIYTNDPAEASKVDLVLRPAPAWWWPATCAP